MNKILGTLLLAASMVVPSLAQADAFPTRPVTVIAGFNAGGTSDMILRAMAPELEKELGQPILVVNKGGNGGVLAVGEFMTKPADGYTMCLVPAPALALNPQMKKTRFSIDDFTYLGTAGLNQEGFFCMPDKPWKDFKGMIEYAKKEGKELTFSSPGVMDTMLMNVVSAKEGIKFRKVPVKSGGETVTNLLGGHVDFGHGGGVQTPYIKAGKMINLVATTASRLVKAPDTPTLLELGYENAGYDNHYILFVLKETPADVSSKLADAIYKVATSEKIQDIIANKANLSPVIVKGEDIKPMLKKQYEEYGNLLKMLK